MNNETKTQSPAVTSDIGTITSENVTLPIRREQTAKRGDKETKTYYTLAFEACSDANQLAVFCKGFKSLLSFFEADFNKAMVSLQVTTPANAKEAKTLTDVEKIAALRSYVSTIDEVTRRRTSLAGEIKRVEREQSKFIAANIANLAKPEIIAQIQAYAKQYAELIAKQEAEASEAS